MDRIEAKRHAVLIVGQVDRRAAHELRAGAGNDGRYRRVFGHHDLLRPAFVSHGQFPAAGRLHDGADARVGHRLVVAPVEGAVAGIQRLGKRRTSYATSLPSGCFTDVTLRKSPG